MLFNSYVFILLFLPITVGGYYYLNHQKQYHVGMLWLFLMSCWFVGYLDIRYLVMLLVSIGMNYGILFFMRKSSDKKIRKRWLAAGVTGNIFLLLYFKYMNFFLENINQLTGSEYSMLQLFLPLGISFYVFQQITCLVDSYKNAELQFNFMEYAVYVSFFPQFIQGPIVLMEEMLPQLRDKSKKKWNDEDFAKGLYAFALGLSKKVLIADVLAGVVNIGYKEMWQINRISAVFVILAYTLQIYFDFSGYCDMALGIGKMFRLELPINFHSPYKGVSIADFWDRWHITLTRFFTRYVYIPLGGSRKGTVRTYVNIFVIFLLSGFWHGAAWTFVLWGVMHGIAMVLKRVMKTVKWNLPKWLEWAFTFVFVNIAWVFFRADTIQQGKKLLQAAWSGKTGGLQTFLYERFGERMEVSLFIRMDIFDLFSNLTVTLFVVFIIGSMIACFTMKNTQEKLAEFKPTIRKMWVTIFLLFWSVISLSGISEFIYFNF